MLLTIGIPTYNRASTVSRVLHDLLAEPASELVEVLVIDDGGADDTFAKLSEDPTIASRVRVLRNDVNVGYPRTFARVFAECRTEYVMLMADDDLVVAENLAPLLDYLERERPAFVSPQFLKGSTVYRGRATTGPITPRQFLSCSAHAPGLVYRVEDCRDALDELASRIESEQADALVYPQVVVFMNLMIAARKCEWFALPTAREVNPHPSGILDADGRAYWSVESRWQQLKSFDSMLEQHAEQDTTGVARQLLDAHRALVFQRMARAIRLGNPALGAAFDAGGEKYYLKRSPVRKPPPREPATVPSRIGRPRILVGRLARRTKALLGL
jgi:glycosyltransferase involved in cell wall biosynthesis